MRTIVAVEPRGDDTIAVKLYKAPVTFAGARVPLLFDCNPDQMPPWTVAGAVLQHGRTIYDKLRQHDAIKEAIDAIQRIQPPERKSLYFYLQAETAERLAWETLCDANGQFLALDRRWPVARMADSEVDQWLPRGDFVPPLRVIAFLSALHKPAASEWDGLRDAALKARKNGLDIDLAVIVGEEKLLKDIQAEIAAQNLTWVKEVAAIPTTVADMEDKLTAYEPHIVHFYCHGSTAAGVSQLQLAVITDWDDDQKNSGSLVVKLQELINFPALLNTWLVTLNCCVGARSSNDLHSMAHRIVAGGVPAAIGMTAPIDATDAHEFASHFYPSLFAHLGDAIAAAKGNAANWNDNGVEFEWAPALHPARTVLRDLHGEPQAHRVWTLPVLYVRPEPFALRYRALGAQPAPGALQPTTVLDPVMQTRVDAVAGALRTLSPDAPLDARIELLALLNNVPEQFRPALDGTFASAAPAAVNVRGPNGISTPGG
jgi:hypothetical protein